ncbi:MAG TPA: S-methyl-5'-thioadenosine phosphorylase [Dermatophilaceae bacterium]|nr:S-methyl-5'-thioadenosine phosphorylase [Dermatophilaceae bacterium]
MTTAAQPPARAAVGVIGGSGLYQLLDDARQLVVETPFGAPSGPLTIAEVSGRRVAFVARHGPDHHLPPHLVPYRANLWALRSVGVRQVLGPCAVGSLVADCGPGTLVVPDQVVDRTWGRAHTVYDEPGPVVHVSFADPYCPSGRAAAAAAARAGGFEVAEHGTLVVVNGPRFSSRAESQWHQQAGGTVVGMTGMPEAAIARELAMCYTALALVTDLDAGVQGAASVSQTEVFHVFAGNIDRLKQVLRTVIGMLPGDQSDAEASCPCRRTLDGLTLPFELPQ